jgi:hypothetical protein
MIDVRRDDRAPARNLFAHEFRRDRPAIDAPNASPGCCRASSSVSISRRWFSRIATNSISGVTIPRRA